MISTTLYSSRTEEWGTPQGFFDALDAEFHFTLDPCASLENHKCQKFYTEAMNGLMQDWTGERVFMNPPYGKQIGQWMEKARTCGALVVCLVHARTDTWWWHNNVEKKADEIRFVRGRLKFGGSKYGAPFPSVIVIYREKK